MTLSQHGVWWRPGLLFTKGKSASFFKSRSSLVWSVSHFGIRKNPPVSQHHICRCHSFFVAGTSAVVMLTVQDLQCMEINWIILDGVNFQETSFQKADRNPVLSTACSNSVAPGLLLWGKLEYARGGFHQRTLIPSSWYSSFFGFTIP